MTPDQTRQITALERDLFWARHIKLHGRTPEQRARGERNERGFLAEISMFHDEINAGMYGRDPEPDSNRTLGLVTIQGGGRGWGT